MAAIGMMLMWPISGAHADGDFALNTAYDFSFTTLTGGERLPLSQFQGQVIMVVNTASQCGFTPQYEGLEKLYETYKDRGFVIVGVPSNDFGQQEPGDSTTIAHFCKFNYGVTFPMAAKENVVGQNAAPFYKWAYTRFGYSGKPKWNFHKYLISRSGNLDDYFHSTTKPDDKSLIAEVEKLLAVPASMPPSQN
jgi:glutathione peroxidase